MLPRARAPTRKPAFAVLMHAGGNALRSVCALNAGRKNSRAPAVGGSACARTILIQSLEGSLCDTETTGECKERLETHKCTRRQSRTATMYCRTRCRKISLLVSRHSGIYKIQGAGAVSTGNNTWHIVDHNGLKFRIDNNVLSPVASYSGVKTYMQKQQCVSAERGKSCSHSPIKLASSQTTLKVRGSSRIGNHDNCTYSTMLANKIKHMEI